MKTTHIGLVIELTTPESYLKIKVIDFKDDKYITKQLKASGRAIPGLRSLYGSHLKSGYNHMSLFCNDIQLMLDSKSYMKKSYVSIKISCLKDKIDKLMKL